VCMPIPAPRKRRGLCTRRRSLTETTSPLPPAAMCPTRFRAENCSRTN